jgi:hypothetical protein
MIPAGIPRYFAVLGFLLGAAYALLMGPFRIPDESGHMYRSYLVSEGVCTGVPAIGALVDFNHLDRFPWTQLPPGATGHDLLKLVDDSQRRPLTLISLFYAVNLYSCLPYIPSGAAFRAGRFFTGSPLTLLYLGRFANLLAFLLLVLLAMRLLPGFQLPIALLALMPMSLHQAASLSADGVTIGLSFVLTAWLLRIATAVPGAPLTRRDYLLLAAGMIVAGLCKSNAGLAFLLILIPEARFPNRRTRWLAIAGLILLAYGTVGAWQLINQPNGEVYTTLKAAAGVYLNDNAAAIFHRPFYFLGHVLHTIQWKTFIYLEQFVGVLGWLEIRLPAWIVAAWLLMLGAVSVTNVALPRLGRRGRLILIAIFLLNIASLLAAFWTTETPREMQKFYAIPIYGRYLIPFALLPMIAIAGLAPRVRLLPKFALVFALLVNLVALRLVWNAYHAHTSTLPNRLAMALHLKFGNAPDTAPLRYNNLLVRRPGAQVEDSKVYLIRGGQRHWIVNGHWLEANGYAWPADVNTIPTQDLAAIPEGEPIQ